MQVSIDRTLAEMVNEEPGAARVLESFGLDYCCGGGQALGDACSRRGIASNVVLDALADLEPSAQVEWVGMSAGELLTTLRSLTGGYVTPEDGCASYRALYAGLAELEADTHLHIHKENNVLFPAAIALEG